METENKKEWRKQQYEKWKSLKERERDLQYEKMVKGEEQKVKSLKRELHPGFLQRLGGGASRGGRVASRGFGVAEGFFVPGTSEPREYRRRRHKRKTHHRRKTSRRPSYDEGPSLFFG